MKTGSHSETPLTTDKETIQHRLRHLLPDRVWVGPDAIGGLTLYRTHPEHWQALEYMRVLTRQEVEKLANSEGVDVMQMVNSQLRTIEGQRKHIATLEAKLKAPVRTALELIREGQIPQGMSPALFAEKVLSDDPK